MNKDFLAMHQPGAPVVVANVWDAATAGWAHEAGFAAVGTSSWAVAEAAGFHDHENAPADDMLAAAARVVSGVPLPVTVDAEAGYGLAPDDLVHRLVTMGAAGFNIEETNHSTGELTPPEQQAHYIADLRAALDRYDDPPVLNARVDAYIQSYLAGHAQSEETLIPGAVDRANQYLAAGADCVFPILAAQTATLARLVGEIDGPVNALALPPAPPVSVLAELGVARVSFGPRHWWAFGEWFREQLRADRSG